MNGCRLNFSIFAVIHSADRISNFVLQFRIAFGLFLALGAMPAIAAVEFSRAGGFCEAPFALTLECPKHTGELVYTLNGDLPDADHGHRYRAPISIEATTVLRATCLAETGNAAAPVTRTYLFASQVLRQTGDGFPQTWGTNRGQPVPADYEMDPEITGDPAYRDSMGPALRSIPTLSLVMRLEDLFDPGRGIYANPRESGAAWERPASLELIATNGTVAFQVNCGVRIQGGWNRRPEESPKHSFRIVFKKKYGPGKLKHPLFGETGAREFDEFILRSGCNNTWLHWSGVERRRGEFIRDQWMRESLAAMGHASARGFFAHLYINGLYWGLYNPTERPSAPFVADHLGGKPEDYDVRNADSVIEGDGAAWEHLIAFANAGVHDAERYQEIQRLVNVTQLADFLILNFYGANGDWDRSSNWYAARRRDPPGPFQFFEWDGERTLEAVDANTLKFDDDQSPPRLFHRLRENPAFQELFAERARRHLTNGGALTAEPAAARYRRWAKVIEQAVIAESARWGDYRRDAHRYKTEPYELYTRDHHWQPEVSRILNEYFPKRAAILIEQFRQAGLYPANLKPER